jgi:hypothetical protein
MRFRRRNCHACTADSSFVCVQSLFNRGDCADGRRSQRPGPRNHRHARQSLRFSTEPHRRRDDGRGKGHACRQVRLRTQRRYLPAQKTEFDKVRTFAQQATHVAEANYFFYNIVSGIKPDMDVKGIETLTKKEDVVAALAGSFTFAHKAIATLTAANAFEVIKSPEPGFQTRGTLASFGISHCWDHYGQMVVYLRMNGLVPPASAR